MQFKRLVVILILLVLITLILLTCVVGCRQTNATAQVRLMVLDPGHFHAALVQKTMYEQSAPSVYVYAPAGPDVNDYLSQIQGFNTRKDDPTNWNEIVYTGPDYLQRMIADKPGNVVVISGNNSRKTDYIYQSVKAGLNVLADKPMVIDPDKFPLLVDSFELARQKGVLLYDIMTERYEITTILQKELSQNPQVFGQLQTGSPDNPAVTKESVHHFFKYVAGNPVKRPAWFFDPKQRGEDLADVSTHLVDLVQWECFPGQIIDYKNDIEMISAKHWPTLITREQFNEVTRLNTYPDYLQKYVTDGNLGVLCNGQMLYKIKGVYARVSVTWQYQPPQNAGDTHYSIMRGTKCDLIIRQGQAENYKPELYVEAVNEQDLSNALDEVVNRTLQKKYTGIGLEQLGPGMWKVYIPEKYRVGHEAHFGQVMQNYLGFLDGGKCPEWEAPNTLAKYWTTTQALKLAAQ
jgi:predicted dehydrogenase